MQIEGTVHHLGEEQQVTPKYTKRELVIKTNEKYPQLVLIEFGQGNCNEYLDKLKLNSEVKVSINIRGREWQSPTGEMKYFNTIQGWRIENSTIEHGPGSVSAPAPVFQPESEDDLPF